RFPSFPNSVWERTTPKLCFGEAPESVVRRRETRTDPHDPAGAAKRSFAVRRSQTEFGNEENDETRNSGLLLSELAAKGHDIRFVLRTFPLSKSLPCAKMGDAFHPEVRRCVRRRDRLFAHVRSLSNDR